MTECQIFEYEISTLSRQQSHDREPRPEQEPHRRTLQNGGSRNTRNEQSQGGSGFRAPLLAAALFAVLANLSGDDGDSRTEVILGLEPDLANGRIVYTEGAQPSCATCHTLSDAGAEADRASSLDALRPSARTTIDSLVSGAVRAHDAQEYANRLTNQQIADLAANVEEVAGD